MRLDNELVFCDAQAFSADAATTNLIDASVARALGDGRRLSVFIKVDVAADDTAGDETYEFELQTDDAAAFGSPTEVLAQAIAKEDLLADTLHEIPIPQGAEFEQFIRINFDGGGTTPTVTATIWLGESGSLPSVRHYPNGYETF